MKHYGIAEWVDYARDLVTETDGSAMRGHLADGCTDCMDAAAFSDRLTDVCSVMMTQTVPDNVVRMARAIFPIQPQTRTRRVFRIPVELIYDSFLMPAPAGLRSTWQVGWQALYRAGDCSLDLRIEPELRTPRASMIGQVSNHIMPEDRMADLAVYLKSGKLIVAETRSNQYGEFQMEYEQQKRLQLCVYLGDGSQYIQVGLKTVGAEKPASIDRLRMGSGPAKRRPGLEQ
jgi:hypothetical protein